MDYIIGMFIGVFFGWIIHTLVNNWIDLDDMEDKKSDNR